MSATNQPQNTMDTSRQIRSVFSCAGATFHLTPAFKLLRSANPNRCPDCGAQVYDATDTPVGREYLKLAGFSRQDKQAARGVTIC